MAACTLSIEVDQVSLDRYINRIVARVNVLGRKEAERRLGCGLDDFAEHTRDWFDIVPSDADPGVLHLYPSARFDEVLAALQ